MATLLDPKAYRSRGPKMQTLGTTKKRRVDRVIRDLDRVYMEAETKSTARYLQLPYIDLYGFPIDTEHLIQIPKEESQRLKMGVFLIKNKEMHIASPTPGYIGQRQKLEILKSQGWKIKFFLCSNLSFEKILHTYSYVVEEPDIDDTIRISPESLENARKRGDSLASLEATLADLSLSEIIETILASAIENKASDIHFEPEKEAYCLRLRLDGVLHTFARLKPELRKPIENRLKVLSGVKLNITNVPQDGRFSFNTRDKEIDVRVSMLPSNYGYSIVMRLLGTGNVALDMHSLGFAGLAKKKVLEAIEKPQGMILTTGPTGSGKTTTLYTFINHLNSGSTKIITLEDPIEYRLSSISQTQIDHSAGYTFADGLRSILRQDPDVVMVGEIRDRETADTAVQGSLTGHLVLSTVHTNDAAGAIPRLMEMGIKGFLLADSLAGIIGQRLVRKICSYCKTPDTLTDEQAQIVQRELDSISPDSGFRPPEELKFYTASGCEHCNGFGYNGRIGIYEVLTMDNNLRELVSSQFPSMVQVREVATKGGMITMLQDGIIKALDQVTDIKEVLRVANF